MTEWSSQAVELLNGVKDDMNNKLSKSDVGLIQGYPTENDIIVLSDGQQRITTLGLLLFILEDQGHFATESGFLKTTKIYPSDYYHKMKKKTASEIWDIDSEREFVILEQLGIQPFIVWENDWNKSKEIVLRRLKKILL